MANERELSLKITGDSSQAERAVARLEQALAKAERELAKAKKTTDELDDEVDDLGGRSDKTGGRLDAFKASLSSFGDRAGDVAKDKLGPLGDVADKAGVDLDEMSGKTLAAGAAVVALGAFVADGVRKLSELTAQVRAYHEETGASWESSGRMVGVIKDLGMEVDNASELMGELARGIDEGKLDEYGIQAVRAKDGTIDLVGTLGNVADKMNATIDPTKKSAMGAALFGETWVTLAPLLNQGAEGIKKMAAAIDDSRLPTEEAEREQKAMEASMRQLGTAVDELQMSMAEGLVPALSQTARGITRVIEDLERMGTRVGWLDGLLSSSSGKEIDQFNEFLRLGGKVEAGALAITKAKEKMGIATAVAATEEELLADAEEQAAHQLRILERHTEDAAAAAKLLTDRTRDQRAELELARETVMNVAGATLGYERALAGTKKAQEEVAEKQREATEAVVEFGEESPEAIKAQDDYKAAVLDAKLAADGQAKAAVEQAEKQAIANGETFTAEQKNLVYRDALIKVRDATNDPTLREGMDKLIQLTGDAASKADDAQRNFYEMEAAASRAAAVASNAVSVTSSGQITTTADQAERNFANQRGTPLLVPQAPATINNTVHVNSYGTNARDLGALVVDQLILERMERGG